MRVGVDIDGVVADFHATADAWLREQTGESHPPTRWDWFRQYTDGAVLWDRFWDDAVRDKAVLTTCEPIAGAIPALLLLEELGHEVVFITHRWPEFAADTEWWLAERGIPFLVAYVADKSTVECDFYVDDKPENVVALRTAGKRAVLFGRPWNTAWDLPRATSWLAVLAHIAAL